MLRNVGLGSQFAYIRLGQNMGNESWICQHTPLYP